MSKINYCFNFSKKVKDGYISVGSDKNGRVPLYNSSAQFGFVNETCAHPPRKVHTKEIVSTEEGFEIAESEFFTDTEAGRDNYNNYGMAFRIKAPAGAYHIYVKTTSELSDTIVSVSGMNADKLLNIAFWDSAHLIPVKNPTVAKGREWTFNYANGRDFIDIEIEPAKENVRVGVEAIVLTPIAPEEPTEGARPTIFVLGDSTAASYVFSDAPMSGWGQVFHNMFDLDRVNVLNYSMGGRSFKNSYNEGRLNDILLTGKVGDYILLQFGHNDARQDENVRFGRGTTDEIYDSYIRDIYIPAIRARGMVPVLVTPTSVVDGYAKPGHVYTDSFKTRLFPDIIKKAGADLGITVIDHTIECVRYYNEIGTEATTAIFMSIEAGETPGKSNGGSYANGHTSGRIDGAHYKEALAKQYSHMIVTEFARKAEGDAACRQIASYLRAAVKKAVQTGDWSEIFPEMANDTTMGAGAYYRNQIEKLLQLGVFEKDEKGNFNPEKYITTEEYTVAVCKILKLHKSVISEYGEGDLTREVMGAVLHDAYHARFTQKPKYMTDYNGRTVTPDDPGYDPNLDSDAKGIMYYPIVSYEQLTDTDNVAPELGQKVKDAYELGLIRSEKGIERGKQLNGTLFEPKGKVTRAKAAKSLYFMWVLSQPVNVEDDLSTL